jgi:outer membrane protein assembly factor BamB
VKLNRAATRPALALLAAAGLCAPMACSRRDAPAADAPAPAPAPVAAPAPAAAKPLAAPAAESVVGTDGQARTLAQTPFEFAWDLDLGSPIHASWTGGSLADQLYLQSQDGVVTSLDFTTGHVKWVTRPLPRPIQFRPAVVRTALPGERAGEQVVDDRIYIVSDDSLCVFDGVYGQLIWRFRLAGGGEGYLPSTAPAVEGGLAATRIFMGSWDGRVHATAMDGRRNEPYHGWQINLHSAVTADPVGATDLFYVGDHDGRMRCFSLERQERWNFDTKSSIRAAALVRGSDLIFGTQNGALHVINRYSGAETGHIFLDAPVLRQPFAFEAEADRVYLFTGSGDTTDLQCVRYQADRIERVKREVNDNSSVEVTRLDRVWRVAGVSRIVGSSPRHLFLARPKGNTVLAVDRATGRIEWNWDLGTELKDINHVVQYADPTDGIRTIVAGNREGKLRAWRLFGQF